MVAAHTAMRVGPTLTQRRYCRPDVGPTLCQPSLLSGWRLGAYLAPGRLRPSRGPVHIWVTQRNGR